MNKGRENFRKSVEINKNLKNNTKINKYFGW